MAVESTMLELGTKAPDFILPDTQGNLVGLDDFRSAETQHRMQHKVENVVGFLNHLNYTLTPSKRNPHGCRLSG